MATVRIIGWNSGLRKVSMTETLRRFGLTLSEAKRITDSVLDGNTEVVEASDEMSAVELAKELDALGAVTSLANASG